MDPISKSFVAGLNRYQVTDHGLAVAVFLTRLHHRLIRTGLSELGDPHPIATPIRHALNRLNTEIDRAAVRSRLAA